MESYVGDRLPNESIYQITWPTKTEDRIEFDYCFMKVEAHIIACTLAIHSLADNLAHVAYFALGINLKEHSLPEHQVTLDSVIKVVTLHDASAACVVASLARLREEPAFQVVEAFVNVAKHRGFQETRIGVEPPDDHALYQLEFGAFAYRDKKHPDQSIKGVLQPSYEAASRAVVDCGNAINALLSTSPPSDEIRSVQDFANS